MQEGLGEPAAEEAGASGEKKLLAAHLVPEGGGMVEDVVEVDGGKG